MTWGKKGEEFYEKKNGIFPFSVLLVWEGRGCFETGFYYVALTGLELTK